MKRLSTGIGECMAQVAGDGAARKARRAADVQTRWRRAVEKVYGDAASFVLSHVNAVYILAEEEPTLIVYSDDSLVRSDLDARQEFLKMALRNEGESVVAFKIIASRFGMKNRHPYCDGELCGADPIERILTEPAVRVPLDERRRTLVEQSVAVIENERLRAAVREAMIAEFEFHGENRVI